MMKARVLIPDAFKRREIALSAMVAERTLERALNGYAVRPMIRERIRREMAARGMESLLPDNPAPSPEFAARTLLRLARVAK